MRLAKRSNSRRSSASRSVGRSAPGGSSLFTVKVDAADLRKITEALERLPRETRKRIYVATFRKWSKLVVGTAGPLLPKRTGRLRRSLGVRVRRYRNTVWAAVGGRVQRRSGRRLDRLQAKKERLGRDYLGAGWRMHLAERGFTPGGIAKSGRRRGQSTKAKSRVPGTGAIYKAGVLHAGRLRGMVEDAVAESIREVRL